MSRLRNVDRYYVKAQQIDFPHATKTVAGPFESGLDALNAIAGIRQAKEYPGCNVTRYSKRVPLAECHPKESA